jgi:acyl CoA:acetate/3-ketoacid CoA transferase alpha subunit
MSKTTAKQLNRRHFFAGAAAIAGTAVVLSKTTAGKKVIAQVEEVVTPEKKGYQLTEHIKKYYKTTLV